MFTRRTLSFIALAGWCSLFATSAVSQNAEEGDAPAAPAPAPAPSATPMSEAAQGAALIESIKKGEEEALAGRGGVTYDPAGRRDPFVSPLEAQAAEEGAEARPPGFPGMLVNELRLQGITVYGDEAIALFLGTDNVGYFAREGDEIWDGKIDRIDFEQQMVVFEQRVDDPSSPIRFRKVERRLHPQQ